MPASINKTMIKAVSFDFTGTLAEFSFSPHINGYQVFKDVIPTLHELKKRGYQLAIISNAGSDLHELLKHLNLTAFFDVIIASQEWGTAKPDPKLFQIAADKLHLQLEEILHVGDSVIDDIEGAEQVGMQCAFLNRDIKHPIDYTISSLQDLLNLLPFLK